MKRFSLVVAYWKNGRGIGVDGKLPWNPLKDDMKFFKDLTLTTSTTHVDYSHRNIKTVNSVIMGKLTYMSLPQQYRPLPGRLNIVVSSSLLKGRDSGSILEENCEEDYCDLVCYDSAAGNYTKRARKEICQDREHILTNTSNIGKCIVVKSLDDALRIELPNMKIEQRFVIGGQRLFTEALTHEACDVVYTTEVGDSIKQINPDKKADVFFPEIPKHFVKQNEIKKGDLSFITYKNWRDKFSGEYVYLNLLSDILQNGETRSDRTQTGTKSLFGKQLTFSLENSFPLLTTKNVWFKGVIEELLFFLRGDHDNRKLREKDVHIWDGNTSLEYLQKSGKTHIQEHDLGLAYGVQWRAAGAKLENITTNYVGKGIDQVKECIELLKNDPFSRRIIINAWNVPQLKDMALVPCHMIYQFYVRTTDGSEKYLDCMMTQRSADTFLGLPFNIASTAALTHIMAKISGYKCGKIIINLGDAHIYTNHIKQVKTQLERTPLKFPQLSIKKELKTIEDIENLKLEDFELVDYHRFPTIKADMAV